MKKSLINLKKISKRLILPTCIILILYSFIRDWNLDEKRIPSDLSNRIFGSKLISLNKSPYYEPHQNSDPLKKNNTKSSYPPALTGSTATPILLWFYSPLIKFNYFKISKIWLCLEYIIYIVIIFISRNLSASITYKNITTIIFSIFTFSDIWKFHTDVGQNYIIYSLLLTLNYYFLKNYQNKKTFEYLAGFISFIFILFRPSSIFFILPNIFLFSYLKRYFIALFTFLIVYLSFVFFSERQQLLWKEYFESANLHSLINRGIIKPNSLQNYSNPELKIGFDNDLIEKSNYRPSYRFYNFNYYKIPEEFGFKKFSQRDCVTHYLIIVIFCLFFVLLKLHRIENFNLKFDYIFIYSIFIYMLFEIFTPIIRGSYNEIQWLAIFAILPSISFNKIFFIFSIILYIFFSIVNFNLFDLQVIFREIILLGMIFISFFINFKTISIKNKDCNL